MFDYIRLQIIYPCNAQCAWCATHRKNPWFGELYKEGVAERIHQFYIQVIRHFRPQQVFISGGEPLLYPEIARFLNDIKDNVVQINLFTSYQFSETARERIPFQAMPLDQILFCHTPIFFERHRWHELTGGFPFDLYVKNIRAMGKMSVQKRFKFIINHESLVEEIQNFQDLVEPDRSFEFGLKVINDQGGGLNADIISKSKALTNERVQSLDRLLSDAGWGKISYKIGSAAIMASLLGDGDVTRCTYRQQPTELRFALYRADAHKQILKYRYCPYFPSDFGYRFHIGRDMLDKLERNYYRGNFRDRCQDCRFLQYVNVA